MTTVNHTGYIFYRTKVVYTLDLIKNITETKMTSKQYTWKIYFKFRHIMAY